jgi:hypothetical protein
LPPYAGAPPYAMPLAWSAAVVGVCHGLGGVVMAGGALIGSGLPRPLYLTNGIQGAAFDLFVDAAHVLPQNADGAKGLANKSGTV